MAHNVCPGANYRSASWVVALHRHIAPCYIGPGRSPKINKIHLCSRSPPKYRSCPSPKPALLPLPWGSLHSSPCPSPLLRHHTTQPDLSRIPTLETTGLRLARSRVRTSMVHLVASTFMTRVLCLDRMVTTTLSLHTAWPQSLELQRRTAWKGTGRSLAKS
jgi:hypothetical protein